MKLDLAGAGAACYFPTRVLGRSCDVCSAASGFIFGRVSLLYKLSLRTYNKHFHSQHQRHPPQQTQPLSPIHHLNQSRFTRPSNSQDAFHRKVSKPPCGACERTSTRTPSRERDEFFRTASLILRVLTVNYSDIIKIIIAILLPPLGVFLERGCGADLLINILLTSESKLHLSIFTRDADASFSPRVHPRHHPRAVHYPQVLSGSPVTMR